jgi:HEPN domain-containing protein
VNRKDFQKLAALRLKEANILRAAGRWEGAYHLGGYAVECAIKACIAKLTKRHDFPTRQDRENDCYTHDFNRLIRLAGLARSLKEMERTHPELNANWTIVRQWSAESRYETPSRADAEDLLRAVEEARHGVLRWLKQYW